jgi:phosphonoacetaldehyde hydrolase
MGYAMTKMGVWPAATVVKVDDTVPSIGEGVTSGIWTVGMALTGNLAGLDEAEFAALADPEHAELRARATEALRAAGADFVIDGLAGLPAVIDAIAAALATGRKPGEQDPPVAAKGHE